MNEILVIILSMLASFFVGVFGMLMISNKTTLNYMVVKMSRGQKVLVFLKTKFGWKSIVTKKGENTLRWKYDKINKITDINDEKLEIHRFGAVDCGFIDLKNDKVLMQVKEGMIPKDFDMKVYSNLLERAITSPRIDDDLLNKFLIFIIVLIVACILINVLGYVKMGEITKQLASMKLATII